MIAAWIPGGALSMKCLQCSEKNVLEEINHDFDKAPTFFLVLVHGHRPISTASLSDVPGAIIIAPSIICYAVQVVDGILIPAPALVWDGIAANGRERARNHTTRTKRCGSVQGGYAPASCRFARHMKSRDRSLVDVSLQVRPCQNTR